MLRIKEPTRNRSYETFCSPKIDYDLGKSLQRSDSFEYLAKVKRKRRIANQGEWGVKILKVESKQATIEEKFLKLSENWKNETRGFSLAASKINNNNYLTIIGLGTTYPEKIVKLILQDLQKTASYWHYALKKITNENPVAKGVMHDIQKTRSAWLNWGIEKGYIVK